ncbi:MAG: hypothetical protein DSM106950_01980 [Stigonema ocellatum SAG 48.90 = DSM 106950]|nr:hypothetical protein [Stigonema ocellatum SAG 48.90 = DSM 106950]
MGNGEWGVGNGEWGMGSGFSLQWKNYGIRINPEHLLEHFPCPTPYSPLPTPLLGY